MTGSGRIRILFTIPNLDTAGSWGAMLSIIRRLPREEFEPAIGVRKLGGRGVDVAREDDVPVHLVPWPPVERPLTTLIQRCRGAARSIDVAPFDVWHSFDYANTFSEPIVAHFAGRPSWVYTKKNMGWDRRAWVRARLAHAIVTQNSDMGPAFFDGRRLRRKVTLIPRGVDLGRFDPGMCAGQPGPLPRRAGHGRITSVAQLLRVKGQHDIVRALAQLPANVELVLAGGEDPDYRREIDEVARRLDVDDRCRILGPVRDVPGLLSTTDVFVHATRNEGRIEGSPVAVLEAMAMALPCVVTDVPGNRDLVRHMESGILVAPGQPDALAEAITTFLSDENLRVTLGQGARQRVADLYSIEREVDQHIDLYRRLVSARQR